MSDFIDTWGLYPWFVECGEDLIHPEDIGQFKPNNSLVFYCKDTFEDYLILQYGIYEYRVKPNNYKLLKEPPFHSGDQVIVKNQEKPGVIEEIQWHYKDNNFIFYISIEGKKKTRRYLDNELIKSNFDG